MKTLKFKTNAKCGGCTSRISEALNAIGIPLSDISIDLTSPDKILTVHTQEKPERIIGLVERIGYKIEQI